MYLEFYRLKRAPFSLTDDPDLLFRSAGHKAALSAMASGVDTRQGLVTVTGGAGVGKTTLVRAYLARVDPRRLTAIYLEDARLPFEEVLTRMFRALEQPAETDEPVAMGLQIQQLLMREYYQGRNVALIIDEAQHVSLDTLAQLWWLTDGERAGEPPLQFVLVGQPALQQTLQQSAFCDLARRPANRATLTPLTEAESVAYIRHGVAKVALPGGPIFTRAALRHIVRHAQGVPPVVNLLCTTVLRAGCAARQQPITAGLVRQVMAEVVGRRLSPWWRRGLAAAGGLGLAAGLLWFAPFSQVPPSPPGGQAAQAPRVPEAPERAGGRAPGATQMSPYGTAPHHSLAPTVDRAPAEAPGGGQVRLEPAESAEVQRREPPPAPLLPPATATTPVRTPPRVPVRPPGPPPPTPATGITFPRPGATVGHSIAVEGVLAGLRPEHYVFLCVQSQAFGRLIYPQGRVLPDGTGQWTVKSIYATPGYRYDTFLVRTTDPTAAALLSTPRARKYGLHDLPPSTERLDPGIVVRRE